MASSTTSFFYTIFFILVQTYFFNKAQSESRILFSNDTDFSSPWMQGRSKRSLADTLPNKLHLHIQYEVGKINELIFIKTKQNLANINLPVDAPLDYLYRNTIMNDVGEFVMYQDLESCSAIVYFEKQKAIFGVIGTDYYIRDFPLRWNKLGDVVKIVDSTYMIKRKDTLLQFNPNIISPSLMNKEGTHENRKRPIDSQAGPSNKRQCHEDLDDINPEEANERENHEEMENISISTEHYYLEILVFISHDVAKIFYNSFKDDYINEIVRYYLTYFNAVDMLFQKIAEPNIKISINIAKIVIEDKLLRPFDFINECEVQFIDIMSQLPEYLKKYSTEYPPDSFDHVFIITNSPIMLGATSARGLTKSGDDLISAKVINKFYEAVPFTVIRAERFYSGYFYAIEEIGQVLSPTCDPLEYNKCLKWSKNSLNQFKVFFKENSNRIFLRNKPRSLLPPGPHPLISPNAQCQCLGYDYHKLRDNGISRANVLINGCTKPLECHKDGKNFVSTFLPFDGTLCSTKKVCWNRKCVDETS